MGDTKKVFAIVTLGTRDIQIDVSILNNPAYEVETSSENRTYKINSLGDPTNSIRLKKSGLNNMLCLVQPRIDGKTILDHLDIWMPEIRIPLISPFIRHLAECHQHIDKLYFIVTDQHDIEKGGYHHNQDTLYYSLIVERKIRMAFPNIVREYDEYTITDNVVNIDHQYVFFGENSALEELLDEDTSDCEMYLMTQGGIDQVNQALVLRFIERYPELVLMQKKEGEDSVVTLNFPNLFLQNLKRRQLKALIDNYDYFGALTLGYSRNISRLCRIAHNLTLLKTKDAFNIIDNSKHLLPESILRWKNEMSYIHMERLKLILTYQTASILYKKGWYMDFIWRYMSINENILKPICEDLLGAEINYGDKGFIYLIREEKGLEEFLKGKIKDELRPTHLVFSKIVEFFIAEKPELRQPLEIYNKMTALREVRNKILHHLDSSDDKRIEILLSSKRGSLKSINMLLEAYLDIHSASIFDTINTEIKNIINE